MLKVLHGGHVACQEQFNIIPMGQNVHSNAKHFYCSWHATWPPCKTSIDFCTKLKQLLFKNKPTGPHEVDFHNRE